MRQAYDYWQDQPGNCLSRDRRSAREGLAPAPIPSARGGGMDRRLSKRNGYPPRPLLERAVGRTSNCLDALLNVLPAQHQRPESGEEQTARTRLPTRGRQAGGVIILRLSAGRAFVLASAQPAQTRREWIAHRPSSMLGISIRIAYQHKLLNYDRLRVRNPKRPAQPGARLRTSVDKAHFSWRASQAGRLLLPSRLRPTNTQCVSSGY